MELRQALPHHTYLQYTATPQAPLLISIIDSLSPNFVQILTPGEDYVGGSTFFADNLPYARVIPPGDVPTRQNPLTEPPDSLLEALRVFMVGVAAGLRQGENTGNRRRHRLKRHGLAALNVADDQTGFLTGAGGGRHCARQNRNSGIADLIAARCGNHNVQEIHGLGTNDRVPGGGLL
jgi:hypothetical protein